MWGNNIPSGTDSKLPDFALTSFMWIVGLKRYFIPNMSHQMLIPHEHLGFTWAKPLIILVQKSLWQGEWLMKLIWERRIILYISLTLKKKNSCSNPPCFSHNCHLYSDI